MKYLIINADDFGMSNEANLAISELLSKKKISSTSLMANGTYYNEAISLVKKNDLKDIGVHLVLTMDDFNVKEPIVYKSLSGAMSLQDVNGKLYVDRACLNKNARFVDLVNECNLQYKKIISDNIQFTHIDNHMYSLFPFGGIKGLLSVLKSYKQLNIKKRNIGIRYALKYNPINNVYEIWAGRKNAVIGRALFRLLKLQPVDYVYSFPFSAESVPTIEKKRECFEDFLSQIKEGITELHIHPCVYSENIGNFNPTWQHRVQEYEMFNTLDIDTLLKKYDVKMITYRDIDNIIGKEK